MKIIHVLLFFTFSAFLFAQEVKTIKAKQEKDITYFVLLNHKPEHKPDGKHIFLKGCNWYCEGSVKSIQASSELKKTDGIDYGPKNAHDFDKNTAWVEGKTDYGIGESIEYNFDFTEKKKYAGELGITRILLANGYKKNKKTWKNNSRVKQLSLSPNGEHIAMLNILDAYEIQTIELGEIKFPANKETKLKFQITQVYKGDKYKNTAISLLMFEGIGGHEKTIVNPQKNLESKPSKS